MNKNIIIYPHYAFNNSDGGITVQYYLAYVLNKIRKNVMICNKNDDNKTNNIYNNFICKHEIDIENSIVIYCEGIIGNPLNAKYVVRWMLSKLGQNVQLNYYFTWNKNELVYFFNTEIDIINKNISYKQLSVFYIHDEFQNLNLNRKGVCFTNRKCFIHPKLKKIHPKESFEITTSHTQNDYIEIFNNYRIFISYDPLTFLTLIAVMCGCMSIIYPIEGVTKTDYFKMTAIYNYLIENNTQLYGVAYGTDRSEMNFAKNTIHLAKKQIQDIQEWFINKYVVNFIKDMDNFNNNKNVLSDYKNLMISDLPEKQKEYEDFDAEFYKSYYTDLSNMNDHELMNHYKNHGINEGRFGSEKKMKEFVQDENFDPDFYKKFNIDLNHMSLWELVHHYTNYGKNEERIVSGKKMKEFVQDENFDPDFYKRFNVDLNHMSLLELVHHYRDHGKNEGRFGSEKQMKELV